MFNDYLKFKENISSFFLYFVFIPSIFNSYKIAESGEFGEFGESGESSIQKRPFIPNIEASTLHLRKKFNKGGPKFDEVWEYFIQGKEVNPGHYKVSCHYCKKEWARALLKAHLTNE